MKPSRTKHIEFIIGDIIAVIAAYMMIAFLAGVNLLSHYIQSAILLVIFMLLSISIVDAYKEVLQRRILKEVWMTTTQITVAFIVENIVLCLLGKWEYCLEPNMYRIYILVIMIVCGERCVIKRILNIRFQATKNAKMIMVVAKKPQAEKIIDKLSDNHTVYKIEGLAVIDEDSIGNIKNVPISCKEDEITDYVSSHIVDEVILSISDEPEREMEMAKMFLSAGIVVHIYMEQFLQEMPHYKPEYISGMNVITCYVREIPLMPRIFKRLMDIAGGIIGCLIALLMGLIIGPIIYVKSPGPIIFTQVRIGKNGRPFKFYKFRSMYVDADERKKEYITQNQVHGLMFKMDHDPRIIPGIGEFIRKTSMDEFPQFLNVLLGDMSLVGTRPPTVDEYERYNLQYNRRLAIKPGITGLWQVSGRSDITDFDEVVRLDNQYIDNWTIGTDVKIILKTILVVLQHKGSR